MMMSAHKEYYFILDATNVNARYNRFLHDFSTADSDKRIKHVNDGTEGYSFISSVS